MTNEWKPMARMNQPRVHALTAAFGENHIYVAGGFDRLQRDDEDSCPFQSLVSPVEVLDVTTRCWTKVGDVFKDTVIRDCRRIHDGDDCLLWHYVYYEDEI